jgi:uncharacterized protein DUF3604
MGASSWALEKPHPPPHVGKDYPTRVYWGDTHVHTKLSVDAFGWGSTLSPEDAYRYALGHVVAGPGGVRMQLRRPLDFLVVADHAENLGLFAELEAGNQALLATEAGAQWYEKYVEALPVLNAYRRSKKPHDSAKRSVFFGAMRVQISDAAFRRSVWERVARTADRYNEPGKFTAFIGYEWTPVQILLHRVVVFKDGAAKASALPPFSQLDSTRPEDLWAHLDSYGRKTGGEVIAIPHNSNLTRGHMFILEDSDGKAFTREYAQIRKRWEPLVEVTQMKGDSETHPELSPTDEFADYERQFAFFGNTLDRGRQYEYARSALKLGLGQEATLGVNPFKFGMIGSSDSHTALSSVDSSNYWAAVPYPPEAVVNRNPTPLPGQKAYHIASQNVAGYAAIWARENTREALFEAMKRREVYATTGSRIELRFFGGWNYEKSDALKPNLAVTGYTKGVPMGGDLTNAPEGRAPSFLIRAVKDPEGANLDRLQVVKGWRDAHGELHERVFNVALSNGRRETKDGRVPPVGSTVDIKDASYTNAIGDPELAVVWRDPDFNQQELAFYYARVIEIPTPRWTAYYAKDLGVEMPSEVPMVTQGRAYSSPIWYTP